MFLTSIGARLKILNLLEKTCQGQTLAMLGFIISDRKMFYNIKC